jgi:peptidoglycan/xylan/chitin deacetylase (PgdA/CDA1 family)
MRVVNFHNVLTEPLDIYDRQLLRISKSRFQRIISYLGQYYNIVPLSKALNHLQAGDPIHDALVVTFDDGFAGVYETARPVLAEAGLVGTVFVLTQQDHLLPAEHLLHFERLEIAFRLTTVSVLDLSDLGLGCCDLSSPSTKIRELRRIKGPLKLQPMDKRETIDARIFDILGVDESAIRAFAEGSSRYRKLSLAQVHSLIDDGWTIGGHTRNHPTLSRLDAAALHDEVVGNALDLASELGLRQIPFAYPYGGPDHVDANVEQMVREAGFCAAFTTIPGDNEPGTDRFKFHRYSDTALMAEHILSLNTQVYAGNIEGTA